MRKSQLVLLMLCASVGFADTLTLRNGQVINGTYLGGTARQIKMEVGDRIVNYEVSDIASLQFVAPAITPAPASAPAPAPAPPAAAASAAPVRNDGNVFRPESQPAPAPAQRASTQSIELPAGTNFVIRMIDAVDSSKNSVGQTFQASMDEPVMLNGETVVPRGADVVVKLVDDKESGRLTGRTELTLDLVSVKVNGRVVDINTQSVTQTSSSRGSRTAKMATGGAALGAIIGAIAGGGTGAAIGAASGAGAGTAAGAITKGQQVHIPSETRLTFTLDTPVKI
ncbi:MAG: hypothetical protein M1541_08960 [Acidobacteria bacterium]|nr:hypothetical protein [Acidobacteriota bacterium]